MTPLVQQLQRLSLAAQSLLQQQQHSKNAIKNAQSESDEQPDVAFEKSLNAHVQARASSLPALIDGGLKPVSPLDASCSWQSWLHGDRDAPGGATVSGQFHDTATITFHRYVLRLDGVRSERHLAILCRQPLPPINQLPPILIYPHGIIEREVEVCGAGEVQLTREQVKIAERFHLHAFNFICKQTPLQQLQSGSDSNDSDQATASASASASASSSTYWSPSSGRHFLIVACEIKSHEELMQADERGWRRVDEHDSRCMDGEEIERELIRQETRRKIMNEGIPTTTLCSSGRDYPLRDIDWEYMKSIYEKPTIQCGPPSSPATHPRSSILKTAYNQRLYLDLATRSKLDAHARFPHPDYRTYVDYYERRWDIRLQHPEQRLILSHTFNPHPIAALQPHPLTEKKLAVREPEMLLVAETVHTLALSAEIVQLFRLMPCVLHRLETHVRQWQLVQNLGVRLDPYLVRIALTTGNAQELALIASPKSDDDSSTSSIPLPSFSSSTSTPPKRVSLSLSFLPLPITYDRLKLVGDSVLKLLITKLLLHFLPNANEALISSLKSRLLQMHLLAKYGLDAGLHEALLAQPFLPDQYLPPGMSMSSPSTSTSSMQAVSWSTKISVQVLADVVSSLIVAAWYSGGESRCMQLIIALGILPKQHLVVSQLHQWPIIPSKYFGPRFSSHLQQLLDAQSRCEQVVGYQFQHQTMFVQAFTHSSWEQRDTYLQPAEGGALRVSLPSSQRLELLGDAVLDVCASTFILAAFPRTMTSGVLTLLRQKLVNNDMMADVMVDNDLHTLLLHSASYMRDTIQQYGQQRQARRRGYMGASSSLHLSPPKQLADAFESLLAAIYVDSGFMLDAVWAAFIQQVEFDIDVEHGSIRVRGGRHRQKQRFDHDRRSMKHHAHAGPRYHPPRYDPLLQPVDLYPFQSTAPVSQECAPFGSSNVPMQKLHENPSYPYTAGMSMYHQRLDEEDVENG